MTGSSFTFLSLAFLIVARAQSSELSEPKVQSNHSNQVLKADIDSDSLAEWESVAQQQIGFEQNASAFVQSKWAPGLCMHAQQGPVVGSLLMLTRCDKKNIPFKWNRDTQHIQVASHPELCVEMQSNSRKVSDILDDSEVAPEDTLLQLQPCISGATNQQWLIGPSFKSEARPDLCITPRALKSNTSSALLEVAYCKSTEKSQTFHYMGVDESAELLGATKEALEHARDYVNAGFVSHSAEVVTAGKLHINKHNRKSSTDAKILNLDTSGVKAIDEGTPDQLMRRAMKPHDEAARNEMEKSEAGTHRDMQTNAAHKDVDSLLQRISEGLMEDEDVDDDDISDHELNDMFDRVTVSKKSPPPPPPPPVINCEWGKWSSWSECSAECGGGKMYRSRGERVPEENGGKYCEGDAEDRPRACNEQACPPPVTVPPPPAPAAAATTPPPPMAKGGAEGTVLSTPAALSLVLLANYLSLR